MKSAVTVSSERCREPVTQIIVKTLELSGRLKHGSEERPSDDGMIRSVYVEQLGKSHIQYLLGCKSVFEERPFVPGLKSSIIKITILFLDFLLSL